jgi:hypothetical protein
MARPKGNPGGINKSAAVRDILASNPNTPVRDIVKVLNQRGIQIHPNLVYLIKSKARAMRHKQKRERLVENGRQMGIANPVELILATRTLAEKAGGIRHLKQLVDALAE